MIYDFVAPFDKSEIINPKSQIKKTQSSVQAVFLANHPSVLFIPAIYTANPSNSA